MTKPRTANLQLITRETFLAGVSERLRESLSRSTQPANPTTSPALVDTLLTISDDDLMCGPAGRFS